MKKIIAVALMAMAFSGCTFTIDCDFIGIDFENGQIVPVLECGPLTQILPPEVPDAD